MRKPPLAKPAFMRTEESGLDYNELLAQDYSVLDPTGVKESSKNVDKGGSCQRRKQKCLVT